MTNFLSNLYSWFNKSRPPIFLIIGAQKSGTTALHSYLSQHQSIRSAITKEIHFFSVDSQYNKGLDFYHSKFALTEDEALFLDASPSYLASNIAYKRIYKYNPKIKMIVLLRDPVERAYSAWNMYKNRYIKNRNWFFDDWVSFEGMSSEDFIRRDDEEIFNFEIFVKNEIKNLTLNPHKMIEAPVLIQGLYAEHLEKFFSVFSREQLLILENTYLREHTAMVLESIELFLAIKKFSFDQMDFSPVFEGEYQDNISQSAVIELSNYYAHHNEALYKLLETRFNWK